MYGWTQKEFLPTPRNQPKNDDWNCFVDQFKAFFINIQDIILTKLHSNTMV